MNWLVPSTVYLSVTTLLILGFKRLFQDRLPACWQLTVWAIVPLRLLLPFLPSAKISLFNALPAALPQPAAISPAILTAPPLTTAPTGGDLIDSLTITETANSINWSDLLFILWAVAAGLLFCYFITVFLLHRRRLPDQSGAGQLQRFSGSGKLGAGARQPGRQSAL